MKIKTTYETTDLYSFRIDNWTTDEHIFSCPQNSTLRTIIKRAKKYMKYIMDSDFDNVECTIISETTGEIMIELKNYI